MTGDEPWLSETEQTAWRTWLRLTTDLHNRLARELQATSDLSYSDFAVLVQLTDDPEGRIRHTDLAEALQWERSRLSHHLKRMEGRALIARTACPDDGRVTYLSITDRGRSAIEQAAPAHAALVRKLVFDHLCPEDLAHFSRINDAIAREVAAG